MEAITRLSQILEIPEETISEALWMLKTGRAYSVWSRAKKSGGKRWIQAAQPPLSEIQARLAILIYPYSVSNVNHGFVFRRSHRTALWSHLEANAMYCFDIKDAFPSVKRKMIYQRLSQIGPLIGFDEALAELVTDLVCYPMRDPNQSFLPQGHCGSPYFFNLVMLPIDRILEGFAKRRGYQITRYVDEYALSTSLDELREEERDLAVEIVEKGSEGHLKVPVQKRDYQKGNGEVHLKWLGLVIEGPKDGERRLRVSDEKLADCLLTIMTAIEVGDFSERKVREIRGKMAYLKSVYKSVYGGQIPLEIHDAFVQYCQMREIWQTGQLVLPI